MKSIFILFFGPCLTFHCFGQIEWTNASSSPRDVITYLISKQNHHVLNLDPLAASSMTVPIVVDSNGEKVFELTGASWMPPGDVGVQSISDIIELNDSSLYFPALLVAVAGGGSGWIWGSGLKVDKEYTGGSWADFPIHSYDGTKGQPLSFDQNFILYYPQGTHIGRQGIDGLNIWDTYVDFFIYDLAVTSNDILVWAGDHGLSTMDIHGNQGDVYPDYDFERIQVTEYDGFVGLSQNTLFLISPDFSPIDSFSFSNDHVVDYSVAHGKVAVLTMGSNVFLFNDSLELSNSFSLPEESIFQKIDIGEEYLGLAGKEFYGTGLPVPSTQTNFVKEYSFTGDDFGLSNDVGVVGVVTGTPAEVITLPDQHELHYNELQVTVQNFGSNPVNQLFLRFQINSPYQKLSKHYTDISLMPNESVTLTWDDFVLHTDVGEGNFQEACFWTSHPDRRLDANSTNDGLCADFLVDNKEAIPTDLSWSIFPNPVYDHLNIQMEGLLEGCKDCKFKVTDISGRERYRGNVDGLDQNIRIPVWGWEAGLYFLQYVSDGGLVKTSRFVVVK